MLPISWLCRNSTKAILRDEQLLLGGSVTATVLADIVVGKNVPDRKDDTDLHNCSIWISIDGMPDNG